MIKSDTFENIYVKTYEILAINGCLGLVAFILL